MNSHELCGNSFKELETIIHIKKTKYLSAAFNYISLRSCGLNFNKHAFD